MKVAELVGAIQDNAHGYGYGAIPPVLILAQAWHESAGFTSDLWRDGNNPFGLKVPTKRHTYATGKIYGHAKFNTVNDAVRDYFTRQRYWGVPGNQGAAEFVKGTLLSGYATDPLYAAKWIGSVKRARGLAIRYAVTLAGVLTIFATIPGHHARPR